MTFLPMVTVAWFVSAGLVWRTDRRPWRSRFFSGRAHAKTHNPRTAWENSSGNRLSWRLRRKAALLPKSASGLGENPSENGLSWRLCFDWIALVPKPARGLGKFEWEPVYHGDSPKKSGAHAKTGGFRPAWENSSRTRLSWRSRTKRDPIGETIRIGEAIWISEIRRDGRCRVNDRR